MGKIELNKETRAQMIKDIRTFFQNEQNEDISDFRAAIFLDFIIETLGSYFYNQAIEDAYRLMNEKIEDLYGLEKRSR